MSGLSVVISDLLPIMDDADLELHINAERGKWRVVVRHMPTTTNVWDEDSDELWQGLDAALSWIWREHETPREEAQ